MSSRRIRTRRRGGTPIGVVCASMSLLLAACSGSTEVSSPTTAESTTPESTAPSTAVTTAPTTAPATTAPTSSAPTTVAPTSAPATAAPVTTTVPTTSAAPTTTAPTVPTSPPPATAYMTADDQLVEADVATGETIRVLDEFFSGEGLFRGGLRLSADRSTIWFSEGYEDSWFACETSVGSWGRVDAATGDIEVLGSGSGVEPSADGAFVAYLTSDVCLEDPENPEFFVLTPNDRVVVRQLATGDERVFVTEPPPDDYSSPSAVLGVGFGPGGNLLVMLGDGRLMDVDVNGPGVIQQHPVALAEVVGGPIAATADALITVEFGDEGSTDLYSVDPNSGESTLLASAGGYMAAGVSAGDQLVVSSFEPVTVSPGAAVTVVVPSDDPFVFDIDW